MGRVPRRRSGSGWHAESALTRFPADGDSIPGRLLLPGTIEGDSIALHPVRTTFREHGDLVCGMIGSIDGDLSAAQIAYVPPRAAIRTGQELITDERFLDSLNDGDEFSNPFVESLAIDVVIRFPSMT